MTGKEFFKLPIPADADSRRSHRFQHLGGSMDGMSVFMSKDQKAHKLLEVAWRYFGKQCVDPAAYYEDFMERDDVEEVYARVEAIVTNYKVTPKSSDAAEAGSM